MKGFSVILSICSVLLIVFVSNHFLLIGVQATSKASENSFTGGTNQTKQGYSGLVRQRVKRDANQLNGQGKEAALPAATASKGSRGLRLYVSHSHEEDGGNTKEHEDTQENSDSLSNESEGAESREADHDHDKYKLKGKSRKSHPSRSNGHKSKKYRQKLQAMQKTVNSLVRKGIRTGEEKKIIKKIAPALEARFHRQKHVQDLRDSKRTSRPQDNHPQKQHLDDIYKMLRGMDTSASAESPSKQPGKYTPKSSQIYQGRKQAVNTIKGLKSMDASQEHQTESKLHSGEVLADETVKKLTKKQGKSAGQMKGRRVNPVATQAAADDGKTGKSSGGSIQSKKEGRSSRLMKGRRVTSVTTDDDKEKMAADKPSTSHKTKKIIVIEPGESVEVIRKSDGYKYPIEYVDMSYEDEEDCEDDKKKAGKSAGISKGNSAVQNNKVK